MADAAPIVPPVSQEAPPAPTRMAAVLAWLRVYWRPLSALVLLLMPVLRALGFNPGMTDGEVEAWMVVLGGFLGVYSVGRTAEVIAAIIQTGRTARAEAHSAAIQATAAAAVPAVTPAAVAAAVPAIAEAVMPALADELTERLARRTGT